MKRTRHRKDDGIQGGNYPLMYASHDEPLTVPSEPSPVSSTIVDEPKSNTLYHDVDHWKCKYLIGGTIPADRPQYYPRYLSNFTDAEGFLQQIRVPTMTIAESAFTHFPQLKEPGAFNAQEFDKLYPKLVPTFSEQPQISLNMSGFSLLNFVYEWKECIHMFHHYLFSTGVIDNLRKIKGFRTDPLRAADALTAEHLSYWFGVRLFVNDVTQLLRILSRWKQNAQSIFDAIGDVQNFRFRDLPGNYRLRWSKPTEIIPCPLFGILGSTVSVGRQYEYDGHGTLAYTYSVRPLVQSLRRLFQLLDSLGVNPDVGIVWDAIPLTFVVDWFMPIGQYMHDNWSHNWFEYDLHLVDYCQSGKYRELMSMGWSTSFFGTDWVLTRDSSHYRRERKEIPPFKPTHFKASRPWKLSRFLVATSLAWQKGGKQRTIGGPSFKKKDPNAPSKSKRAKARLERKAARLDAKLIRIQTKRTSKRFFDKLQRDIDREVKAFERKNKPKKEFLPRPSGVKRDNPFLRSII